MNLITHMAKEINIRGFESRTQRLFKLISILECGEFSIDELQSRLDVSKATVYRLLSQIKDVLWNYEVVNTFGYFSLERRA
jgi:predicted DNA-binding transcriptional regulator YafY